MTDSVVDKFNRIYERYNVIKAKHRQEIDNFLRAVKEGNDMKGGLLCLLETEDLTKLRVSSQQEGQMRLSHFSIEVYVCDNGWASLCLGDGLVVDMLDDKFKQVYSRLKQVYEEQTKRKTEEKPLPF